MTNKDAQLDSYKDIATLSVVIAKLKRGYIFVFQEKEKGFQTNFHKRGCASPPNTWIHNQIPCPYKQ